MNEKMKALISSLTEKANIPYLLVASIGLILIVGGFSHTLVNGVSAESFAYLASGIAGLFLLLITITVYAYRLNDKLGGEVTHLRNQNRRNQDSILNLLDEMGDLADGDLTVTATVTEEITGAIADSINYTIDALRTIVEGINSTTLVVTDAARESRDKSLVLSESSSEQVERIKGASEAIQNIATSIGNVSDNAAKSTRVASQSVKIAVKGAETVRTSIEGMNNIREQIQETSKRIKRLGESSQQIGDIVELIDDIADQTNILALNASIQASMAGEAGRGFAVVADEVQSLAERSGDATKQIEALVQTIQSDTHEAIISMEKSTTEVVSGAKLSEAAGTALEQIENVSLHLARLVQNIFRSAKQQSVSAANISETMMAIEEFTQNVSEDTHDSAESIGHLLELGEELRQSVSDFKLPG